MKKGISIWSFTEPDIKKCLMLAKDAGFDGVELALDEQGPVSLTSTKEEMLEIKAFAESIGLELYSVAVFTGLTITHPVMSRTERKQKQLQRSSWRSHPGLAAIPS